MAGFNLTAQLNLRGPNNVRQIVSDIRRQLGTITGDVNLRINATATRNIAQLNAALTTLNTNLSQTQNNANAAASAITAFANAANSINRASSATSRQINATTSATNRLSQSQRSAQKALAASTTEMEEFGKQSALAVRRFAAFSGATGVILGLTNAFRSGISAFIEYEKEFIKVQQVTDKSAEQLSGLDSEIRRLSVGLGVASADLINVSSTLAQAGLTAGETQKALQALALTDLSPSFDSLNDTVEGSIALMRQFGISASELERSLGSVNAVAAAFAVESGDLIAAIQRTGGVFAAASRGVSEGTQALNEFLAVFTSIRQTTRESAETIATGLRTIFTRIQRTDTIEALRDYGISLTDVEGKFVGAYKAVELLSKGLSSLDPRDIRFSSIVEELGGFRQIGKVIPLIQQFSVAQQALGVAQRGQDSLAKDAAVAQQSLANQISKVREEFLSLMRTIGSSDTFQTIARSALGFTSVLLKVADSIKGVLPVLAIIGAGKIASGIGQFTTGFFGGLTKTREGNQGGGGSGPQPMRPVFPSGGGGPSAGSPTRDLSVLDDLLRQNTQAINALGTNLNAVSTSLGNIAQYSQAVQANTASLINNTTSIDNLTQAMNNSGGNNVVQSINNLNTTVVNATNALARVIQSRGAGPATLNKGGKVLGFNRGGVVPGVGNGDTVPAMLEPGEFVIRKKAVETIGAGNLQKMNKYANGGKVQRFAYGGEVWDDPVGSDFNIDRKAGARISDGDTIAAKVFTVKEYRLDAVDAAESNQKYGKEATNILNQYKNNVLDTITSGTGGAYGRGKFKLDSAAGDIVRLGYGIPDVRYGGERFGSELKEAKSTGRGIWNSSNYNHPKRILFDAGNKQDKAKEIAEKRKLDYSQRRFALGGIVQKFAEGSPGGVKLSKGRGKTGIRGARDIIDAPSSEQYLKWAKEIYDEYDADESLVWATDELGIRMPPEIAMANRLIGQYVFERGGAGMSVGKKFVRTPSSQITEELMPYLVPDPSDPSQMGFYQDDVRPFMRSKTMSSAATAKLGKQAALVSREAEISKYTGAESAISEFKKTGVLSMDSGIMNYINSSISNLDALPLEQDEIDSIRKKLTKPNMDALSALMGPNKTPVSVQGQRTKLSEVFGAILETYGSNVSDLEVDNIVTGMGAQLLKADKKSLGGLIQRFMAGSIVQEAPAQRTVDPVLAKLLERIQKVGGTTQLYGYVTKPEMDRIISTNTASPNKPSSTQIVSARWLGAKGEDRFGNRTQYAPALEKILEVAELKYEQDQALALKKAGLQTQAGSANKFGLASIFPLGANQNSEVKEIEGNNGKKYLTQLVMKGLPSRYGSIVEKYRDKLRATPSDMAQEMQYADIFGTGGPLAFDFDETLVKDADIPGKQIQDYNDLTKVQAALENAELTLLGQELSRRLNEYPQLLDNIRVLTARPQSNAPYLAAKLNDLGLNIPTDKITGVSGGLNKVNNLSYFETLIDDNLENLQSVRGRVRGGLGYPKAGTAIGYQEPTGYRPDLESSVRSQKVIQGYIAEELLRELGAPLKSEESDPIRPIDYPNGLGVAADIWGLPTNMPTDVKREINPSAISRLWAEAQKFYVEKFNAGGKVDPLLEKYKTIIASIMPAEYIGKDGFLAGTNVDVVQSNSMFLKALKLAIPSASFGSTSDTNYAVLLNSLRKNKNKFSESEYRELEQFATDKLNQSGSRITIGPGSERLLPHEAFHTIQTFLALNHPEIFDNLTQQSLASKDRYLEIYNKSKLSKSLFGTYSPKSMFGDMSTGISEFRGTTSILPGKYQKSEAVASLDKEISSIRGANEIIPSLLDMVAFEQNSSAQKLLSDIFASSGLNQNFIKNMPQKFWFGGKVNPLAKKYGLTQKEFDEQEKIAQMMGLDKTDFEQKLKLFSARKQKGKDIKFGLLDTQAEFMASSSLLSDEEKALQEFLGSSKKMNIGGLATPDIKEKQFGKIGLRTNPDITATYFKNNTREGFVTAKKSGDNLFTVGLSKATQGYGPKLYDVVMEAATAAGGMLTSDRNQVSSAARSVWAYYFKNRGDVKKTPLDPSQWTKNQSYIDPKLYGRKETWPPSTDPAWILQSGYSKSPDLINSADIINMDDPKYAQFLQQQQVSFMTSAVLAGNMRNNGGKIFGYANGGSVKLYHGSNTGTNDSVLNSFKEKGALSNIAKGYGQGAGFYVYTEKDRAATQAKMRVEGGSFGTVVSGDTSGRPMVLTFDEMLTPENYDLDYEIQKNLIVKWLYDNYDQMKEKLPYREDATGIIGKIDQNREMGIMSSGIRVQEGSQKMIGDDGQEYVVNGGSRRTLYSGTDSNVREGALVGQLMGRLQANDPQLVNTFESELFKKPYGLTLKYVGSTPLTPTNIETFAYGGKAGISSEDTVPALLTPGEFVINKKAAQNIGYAKLAKLNQADKLKGYNKGGSVGSVQKFAAGGTAGYDDSAVASLMTGLEMLAKAARDAAFQTERAAGASVSDAWTRAQAAGGAAISREANARLATAPTARDQANINEALSRLMSGSAPPGTPTPSPIDMAARRAADALEYFTLQAEYYGTSVSKFTRDLRQQIISQTLDLGQQTPQNINRFRTRVSQLRGTLALPDTGDNADRISDAREELADSLKEITGIYDDSRINASIRELETNLDNTSLSFGEAINNSRLLSGLFADATNKGRQYERVLEQFSQATGVAVEELRKVASLEDVARAEENRKLIQSTNKLTGNLNKIAIAVSTFGGIVAKLIDAPNSRSARATSAAISGGTQTAGSLLAFGSNVLSTTAATAAMEGGGALATGAQALLPLLTNPITLAVGGVVVALGGFAAAAKDAANAAREFDIQKASNDIERGLARIGDYFKDFAQDFKNLNLLSTIQTELQSVTTDALNKIRLETEVPKSFWLNFGDSLSMSQKEAAESSRILEKRGFGAYQETVPGLLTQFLGGRERANRARNYYTSLDAPEMAAQQSQQLQPIAENVFKLIEERLRSGENISEVMTSVIGSAGSVTDFATTIARANPVIEEQIIRIKTNNDLTEAEKQQRINSIVAIEAEYRARLRAEAVIKEIEFKRLSQETKVFTTSIQRMLNAMDSAIGRTTQEITKMSVAAELSNQALSGSAQAGEVFIKGINVLQNRRAYSQQDQELGVGQASRMFGPMSDTMTQLLNISNKLEDAVLSTINETIRNTPGESSPERIAGAVRASLNTTLADIGLPPELSEKLAKATQNAFAGLRAGENKNLSFAELVEKVPQFAEALDVAKSAQDSAIRALEFWQTRVNEYAKAMNQSLEYQLEANNRFRKSFDIRVKAEEDLSRTLGKPINLVAQQQTILNQTGALTGGVTNPNDIRDAILRLENVRSGQQALVEQSAQGGPENQDAVQRMTRNLNRTNLALRENYEALKNMADSSDLASAALAKMNELQQRNQAGQTLIEKAVTSNASEIMRFNRSLYMLNRNMSGQLNPGSTAEQRSEVLQTFSLIAPLLGENQNALKANVFESLLLESGVGIGGLFADVLTSLRNPEADPIMSEAISIYKKGVELQSKANEALGKISEAMSRNTAESAGNALAATLQVPINTQTQILQDINSGINTLVKLAQGNQPQQRADGGMIYANQGMFVNFKAKGTDTVPAMLTPGEFVVNREATQKNLPLLKNINSGKTSYYARGGIVVDNRWAGSSYAGKEIDLRREALENNDQETLMSFLNLKDPDPAKIRGIPSNIKIVSVPNSYYATGKAGSLGDSFSQYSVGDSFNSDNLDAAPGVGYNSVATSLGRVGLRVRITPEDPTGPAKREFKNIGNISSMSSLFDIIDTITMPRKPIKELEINKYKDSYKELLNKFSAADQINKKITNVPKDEDINTQLIRARNYFKSASKLSTQRGYLTSPVTISNLSWSPGGLNSQLLFEESNLPTTGENPGNILGFKWGYDGSLTAVAGTDDMSSGDALKLRSNVIPYNNFRNSAILDTVVKSSNIAEMVKKDLSELQNPDLELVESDVSATRKGFIAKLENLYDKKIFQANFGPEIFKDRSSDNIRLPVTLYNTDPLEWENYISRFDKKYINKSISSSRQDDLIKLEEIDTLGRKDGNPRYFPWTSSDFKDDIGLSERFEKDFNKEKPIRVETKEYGKVGEGKFNIQYKKVSGRLFNEKTGSFDGDPLDYLVIEQQSDKTSPGSPFMDLGSSNKLFFQGGIEELISFLDDRTPSYNVKTGQEIKPKIDPGYSYPFLSPKSGIIKNNNANIKKLLSKNAQYAQNSDIQQYIVSTDRDGVKYIRDENLFAKLYKKVREDKIEAAKKEKTKKDTARTSGSDIFGLKDTLTEDDKKAGLTYQDLESFSAEKRVTFARSFYDKYSRSFGIKSTKPKQLSDLVSIANELDSKLPEISLAEGGTGGEKWSGYNALRAIFTSLYQPKQSDAGYFKRLGFPLDNKSFLNRIPPPLDPVNPERTPIQYYDKLANNIDNAITLLYQREKDYTRANQNVGKPNRTPFPDLLKQKIQTDTDGFSLTDIDTNTGAITELKDKQKIQSWADVEKVALNPYNIPSRSSNRQNLLKQLAYFYQNDKDANGNNMWPRQRWEFIGNNAFYPDTDKLTKDNILVRPQTLRQWYSIQDNILNNSQNAKNVSEQIEELNKIDPAAFEGLRNSLAFKHAYSSGLVYGPLPNLQYFKDKLGVKQTALAEEKPEEVAAGDPNLLSRGGVVYASTGRYIDFKPKGTDTIPAMLTPGEFVVNKTATQKNLPALKAMNSGGVIYRQNGSITPEQVARGQTLTINQSSAGPITVSGGTRGPNLGQTTTQRPVANIDDIYKAIKTILVDTSTTTLSPTSLPPKEKVPYNNSNLLRKLVHAIVDVQTALTIPSGIMTAEGRLSISDRLSLAHFRADNMMNKQSSIFGSSLDADPYSIDPKKSTNTLQRFGMFLEDPTQNNSIDRSRSRGGRRPPPTLAIGAPGTQRGGFNRAGQPVQNRQYAEDPTQDARLPDMSIGRRPPPKPLPQGVDGSQRGGFNRAGQPVQNRTYAENPNQPIPSFTPEDSTKPIPYKDGYIDPTTGKFYYAEKPQQNEQSLATYTRSVPPTAKQNAEIDKETQKATQEPKTTTQPRTQDKPIAVANQDFRKWIDSTGMHSAVGKLVAVTDQKTKAVLQRKNDSRFIIPLDKLSPYDNDYIKGAISKQAVKANTTPSAQPTTPNGITPPKVNTPAQPSQISPNRIWYGGRLWDLNNDGKEQETISGNISRIIDADRVMINTKDVPGGQLILRREFMTKEDLALVKAFEANKTTNAINRQFGGVVYANNGQLINFQPRGTDTVPAMLTPGEFVVNAKSTSKNLSLLQAINDNGASGNGSNSYMMGGVVYAADGVYVRQRANGKKDMLLTPREASRLGVPYQIGRGSDGQYFDKYGRNISINEWRMIQKADDEYVNSQGKQGTNYFDHPELKRQKSFASGPATVASGIGKLGELINNAIEWEPTTPGYKPVKIFASMLDMISNVAVGTTKMAGAIAGLTVGGAAAIPATTLSAIDYIFPGSKDAFTRATGFDVEEFVNVMNEGAAIELERAAMNYASLFNNILTAVDSTFGSNLESTNTIAQGIVGNQQRLWEEKMGLAIKSGMSGGAGGRDYELLLGSLEGISVAASAVGGASLSSKLGSFKLTKALTKKIPTGNPVQKLLAQINNSLVSGGEKVGQISGIVDQAVLPKDIKDAIQSSNITTSTQYRSIGGAINFQPKGTDTVPAMLTPGEFVINKKSTQKHLQLLQAINNGSSTHQDIVSRFNMGGYVKPNYYQTGSYVAPSTRNNSFDFAGFMQRLMGQLSSIISGAIKEGFRTQNSAQNIDNRSNGVSINVESQVLDRISEFTNRLRSVADTLAGLSAIPSEIKITGRHDVNVIINGDSVLNQLNPEIQQIVMNEIRNSFRKLVNQNSPVPSDKLINPFDTNIS